MFRKCLRIMKMVKTGLLVEHQPAEADRCLPITGTAIIANSFLYNFRIVQRNARGKANANIKNLTGSVI